MARRPRWNPKEVLTPTRLKLKCFGWTALISCILFAFILKGVDMWILIWGWILLWPMLAIATSQGGITADNVFTIGLAGLVCLIVYWYVFACVWITLKDYIES